MAMPTFTMRQLLEAGIHFGHTTRRWNPLMRPYIFGERNGIHIIDLEQTVPMLHRGLEAVREVAAGGGRVLFVGTKRQATEIVATAAVRCGQYYVNHRWLGGMLTNWRTISNSIKRLRDVDEQLVEEDIGLTKKEMLRLTAERDKLERALGGIKEMGSLPDILFVVDTNKEAIAVAEAQKLGIPVVAILDSNSDPRGITHPVPGNDDAMRAISLYCDLVADCVLDGLQAEMLSTGVDIGEGEIAPIEELPAAAAPAEAAPEGAAPEVPAAKTAAEAPAAEASAAEVPAAEAPAAEAPAAEAPAAEAPAAEAPAAEAPAAEAPAAEAPAAEAPAAEAPAAEAPAAEAPAAEAPAAEAPAAEAPAAEAPAAEAPAAEAPAAEAPAAEAPAAEAPAAEAPAAEAPAAEAPAAEAPAAEAPAAEAPAAEAPAAEAPAAEAPAAEAPAAETPAAEAPAAEAPTAKAPAENA